MNCPRYAEKFLKTGLLHGTLYLDTVTCRSVSYNPLLQKQPRSHQPLPKVKNKSPVCMPISHSQLVDCCNGRHDCQDGHCTTALQFPNGGRHRGRRPDCNCHPGLDSPRLDQRPNVPSARQLQDFLPRGLLVGTTDHPSWILSSSFVYEPPITFG